MKKKIIGIILCIILTVVFLGKESLIYNNINGALEYNLIDSALRILFFTIGVIIFIKIYKKNSIKSVLHFNGFIKAIPACIGMFIFIALIVCEIIVGVNSWSTSTVPIVLSCLFLGQLATGLFEEFTFRAFICEGYYQGEPSTFKRRLLYAGISAVLFGLAHVYGCNSFEVAIYKFFVTGINGFAFASVYLYTHNILAASFIHFFYDIFANISIFVSSWKEDSVLLIILDNFVYWAVLAIVLIVAFVFLYKKPIRE